MNVNPVIAKLGRRLRLGIVGGGPIRSSAKSIASLPGSTIATRSLLPACRQIPSGRGLPGPLGGLPKIGLTARSRR